MTMPPTPSSFQSQIPTTTTTRLRHRPSFVNTTRRSLSLSPISIYVVGDVPYSDMEKCLLPFEIDKLTIGENEPSRRRFVIHLGDIRDGKPDPSTFLPRKCMEDEYKDLATIFERSPLPTFFIPGDNGLLDCSNANEAYTFWQKYLFHFYKRTDLKTKKWPIDDGFGIIHTWDTFPPRQQQRKRTTVRDEFFSFVIDDSVLFIGLGLPGNGRSNENHEWINRDEHLQDNIQWTRENLNYFSRDVSAVVIFGHDYISSNNAYYHALQRMIGSRFYDLPILFLEDGHRFDTERNFLNLRNMYRIRTEDTVTPMIVTIHPPETFSYYNDSPLNVFEYNRRCRCSTKHRPTQLITYPNNNVCYGECIEAQNICALQDRCSPKGYDCSSRRKKDPLG